MKCSIRRQFLADELHAPAVCDCFDPFFVWHFSGIFSRSEYTLFDAGNRSGELKRGTLRIDETKA
jgi:hypothetical protein